MTRRLFSTILSLAHILNYISEKIHASMSPAQSHQQIGLSIKAHPAIFTEPKTSLRLKLRCETAEGETIFLTGNHVELGLWNPLRGVEMRKDVSTSSEWIAELPQQILLKCHLQYKYVKCSNERNKFVWEERIPDRILPASLLNACASVPNCELIVDDGSFNVLDKAHDRDIDASFQHVFQDDVGSTPLVSPNNSTSDVSVTFQVSAEDLKSDDQVFVCGSGPRLGEWDAARALRLAAPPPPPAPALWSGTVLLPVGGRVLYKYLVRESNQVLFNTARRTPLLCKRNCTLDACVCCITPATLRRADYQIIAVVFAHPQDRTGQEDHALSQCKLETGP